MNHQGADHQRHRGVAGNTECEHRNETRLSSGIVGGFRTGDTGNISFTKRRISMAAADFFLKRVGSKRGKQGTAAGKNTKEGAQQGTAGNGRRGLA